MLLQAPRLGAVQSEPRVYSAADIILSSSGVIREIQCWHVVLRMRQEDGADVLHLATAILLFHGRATEVVFETLQAEGAFPRIVQLIHERRDDDIGLHRLLIELMYEMSRVQKLSRDDLSRSHTLSDVMNALIC